ncbi:hypothetical protein C8J56DRAFT_893281 [Mycena floridula]|nr:hypothetical protein C8J56DRAFT_893281 [Mycena floridula]
MSVPGVPPSAAPGLALDLGDAHGGLYVSTHFVAAFWGISCMQFFQGFGRSAMVRNLLELALVDADSDVQVNVDNPKYTTLVKYWGNPAALLMNENTEKVLRLNILIRGLSVVAGTLDGLDRHGDAELLHLSPLYVSLLFWDSWASYLISVDFYYAYGLLTVSVLLVPQVQPDTGLAACMTYWLVKESRGTQGSSHDMVVRLVTLTINSGFWTASVALAALVTSIVSEVQTYGAVYYILCALYCNTVLANLNARGYIRGSQRSETQHIGRSATSVNLGGITSQAHEDSHPSTIIQEDKMKAHFGQSEEV